MKCCEILKYYLTLLQLIEGIKVGERQKCIIVYFKLPGTGFKTFENMKNRTENHLIPTSEHFYFELLVKCFE